MQIHYPYHPSAGSVLPVVGEVRLGDEHYLVVLQSDGTRAHLPQWMFQPSAANFSVHPFPRISLQSLLTLRMELDGVLSLLFGTKAEPGDLDEAQQRTGAIRPIYQHAGATGIDVLAGAPPRTRGACQPAAVGSGSRFTQTVKKGEQS